MRRTILRLMGLILVLQGILTIGLTIQWFTDVTMDRMIQSKESLAIIFGIMLWILADCKMGGLYEN